MRTNVFREFQGPSASSDCSTVLCVVVSTLRTAVVNSASSEISGELKKTNKRRFEFTMCCWRNLSSCYDATRHHERLETAPLCTTYTISVFAFPKSWSTCSARVSHLFSISKECKPRSVEITEKEKHKNKRKMLQRNTNKKHEVFSSTEYCKTMPLLHHQGASAVYGQIKQLKCCRFV